MLRVFLNNEYVVARTGIANSLELLRMQIWTSALLRCLVM